jgi:hypothetical protein
MRIATGPAALPWVNNALEGTVGHLCVVGVERRLVGIDREVRRRQEIKEKK